MNGHKPTLIVGVGSDFGDDQLGLLVARALADQLPNCGVVEVRSPIELYNFVTDIEQLHIVDACRGDGPSGKLYCQDWRSAQLQSVLFSGTHDFDLITTLKLVDELVGLPPYVKIWGIDVANEENACPEMMHAQLSPEVAASVSTLTALILNEVKQAEAGIEEPTHHA